MPGGKVAQSTRSSPPNINQRRRTSPPYRADEADFKDAGSPGGRTTHDAQTVDGCISSDTNTNVVAIMTAPA